MSNPFLFEELEFVPHTCVDAKAVRVSFAPDNSAGAILFDNFVLTLDGNSKELSAVSVATLRLPAFLPDDRGLVGYVADLRGFVQTDANSRAVLMADIGGTVTVIEFPYGGESTKDYIHDLFSLERRIARQNQADALPIPPYVVTITLSVQRLTSESNVQITLDSLNFGVITTA